jgi:hypothetical protein
MARKVFVLLCLLALSVSAWAGSGSKRGRSHHRYRYYHRPANGFRAAPTSATAICKDGTYSFSRARGYACRRHGGISAWLAQ